MNIALDSWTKRDVNVLKAFGILLIVLHNFLHLTNDVGENEMYFQSLTVYKFMDSIASQPSAAWSYILSFLGHYGVQIFIFCTGYGLAKSFSNKSLKEYPKYFLKKIALLYLLILIGLVWYSALSPEIKSLDQFRFLTVFFFKMTSTFSYGLLFAFIGPWWYMCLAVQLYFTFPLLKYLIDRYRDKYQEKSVLFLLLLSYILIYGLFKVASVYNFPMFANVLGHLPEFIFGIGVATYTQFRINGKLLIGAIIVFVLSCFFKLFFPLSFMSMLIILLTIFHYLKNGLKKYATLENIFVYIGQISMFIFILNAIPRTRIYKFFLREGVPTWELFCFLLMHLAVVGVMAMSTAFAYNWVMKLLPKKKPAKIE